MASINKVKSEISTRTGGKKGSMKSWMQKLSKGLMLPIAILPIAGLFLGIGAGIENILIQAGSTSNGAYVFANVLKQTGDIVFANLPILFAVAVAIAFTDDAGVAGLSAVLAWAVMNGTQQIFINDISVAEGFDKGTIYSILFYSRVPGSVVTQNIGITSMQTSVFGGIIVGLTVAGLYNKFKTTQLPAILGFFSGTRFVLIVTFLTSILLGFGFLMLWPFIGIQLEAFGRALAGTPAGIDAFAFGVVERALVPFGLHHAFYTPLWFTSVGGVLVDGATGDMIAEGNQYIWFEFLSVGIDFGTIGSSTIVDGSVIDGGSWTGSYHLLTGTGGETFYMTQGVNPGSYMQGKYPFMIFGLPAAGAAIVMSADKENRASTLSIISAAAFTAFLTGITEPLEFTFLFIAPALYYGVHVFLAGISFWALDMLNANLGMTFSGGIFDFILYGILPGATGFRTGWYHVVWIGALLAPIYYFTFYYWIKKFNVATPGRNGAIVETKTKADYQKRQEGTSKKEDRSKRVDLLVKNLGGLDNLDNIDACITRLRLTVKDRSIVDDAELKKMGAAGIVGNGTSVQVIFGGEADIFKTEIKALKFNQ